MIKCINCGAPYKSKLAECPYCGRQNLKVANERFNRKIGDIVRERKDIEELPVNVVKKTRGRLWLVLLVGLIIATVCFIVYRNSLDEKTGSEEESKEANLKRFEKLLVDKKYGELELALESAGVEYDYYYNKYSEVVYTDKYRKRIVSYCEEYLEEEGRYRQELLDEVSPQLLDSIEGLMLMYMENIYDNVFSLHDTVTESLNDTSRLGNDEYLREIYDEALAYVKEQIGLSDEQLEDIFACMEIKDYTTRRKRLHEMAADYMEKRK